MGSNTTPNTLRQDQSIEGQCALLPGGVTACLPAQLLLQTFFSPISCHIKETLTQIPPKAKLSRRGIVTIYPPSVAAA